MPDTRIRTALLSVYDKTGIVDLARGLAGMDVRILSTGGTAGALRDAGIPVTEIADYTGSPEILGGRVKTLHPKIFGGILARPEDLGEAGIEPIDLVGVNLYPFEKTVAVKGVTFREAIEKIDIGGVTLLRAAAKNHERVTVIADPARYGDVLREMEASGGQVSGQTRAGLARDAFQRTAVYDRAISGWLGGPSDSLDLLLTKVRDLRYGENPHQIGALCRSENDEGGVAGARIHGGKEISYNNILDLTAASRLAADLDGPGCAIIKHASPCGTAVGGSLQEAFRKAHDCDPLSAFGSVIAFNRALDPDAASEMVEQATFVEAVIAPGIDPVALGTLQKAKWGKSVRILEGGPASEVPEIRSISGGFLVQQGAPPDPKEEVVTERRPSEKEWEDLRFAWRVVRHARSNAIVLVRGGGTVGIGAGQVSRVDSVHIAVRKAGEKAKGAVLASDGFFPFPDGLEAAAAAGVTAAIQPGGSRRDQEVVDAANRLGVAMVMTGVRHFMH